MKKFLIGIILVIAIATPYYAENRLSLAQVRSYRFETVPELSLRVANMIWSLKDTRYVKERVINGVYTLVFRYGNHIVEYALPCQGKELSVFVGSIVICDKGLDGIVEVDTTEGRINDFFYNRESKFATDIYPKLDISVRQMANYQYSRILIDIYEEILVLKSEIKFPASKNLTTKISAPCTRGFFFSFTIPLKRTSMLKK